MRIGKTVVISFICAALFCTVSFAKKNGQITNPEVEQLRIIAELGLTPSQVSDLQSLRVEFEPRLKDIQKGLKDKTITREQAREDLVEMRAEFEEKASGILTPEQMEKANKIIDRYFEAYGMKPSMFAPENGKYMQKKPPAGVPEKQMPEVAPPEKPGGLGLLFLQRTLGLSDEQLAAIAPLFSELRQQALDLKDQYLEGLMTKQELTEGIAVLREEIESRLSEVLTSEQVDSVLKFVEKRFLSSLSKLKRK